MNDLVRRWIEAAAAGLPLEGPVVEFGSLQVEGQEGYADLRPLFPGMEYVGCDIRPGPGVDRLEDVERSGFDGEWAGTVVCVETLEHVKHPWIAAAEMFRVLKPGGTVLLAVPFNHPLHDHPHDYWRMTPEALAILLAEAGFEVIETSDSGEEVEWDEAWDKPGRVSDRKRKMPFAHATFAVARKPLDAADSPGPSTVEDAYFAERLEVLEGMIADKDRFITSLKEKIDRQNEQIEIGTGHVAKVEAETKAREAALDEAAGYARNLEARIAELEERLRGGGG